jgi:hypothetical protein
MVNIVYWVFISLLILALAYTSLFSSIPLAFLAGGGILSLIYLGFLLHRRRQSGEWEHGKYQFRFAGTVFVYIALFWTTVGLFSNVKEQRVFFARYEPYIRDGVQHGYTFHYIDHPGAYENIDSAYLNRYLEENKPDRVRLVLETVKDFGRLRSYSVRGVETISVNEGWIGGTPPWDALRQP